jgi:hypothetical protein
MLIVFTICHNIFYAEPVEKAELMEAMNCRPYMVTWMVVSE